MLFQVDIHHVILRFIYLLQEVADLREQLRDVMFYLEAQQKLSSTQDVSQEEIQDGQVIVGAAAASPDTAGKKRSKKRK